jgi:hypothetical protein
MNSIVEKNLDERIAELEKNKILNIHFGFMDTSCQIELIPTEDIRGFFFKARMMMRDEPYNDVYNVLFKLRKDIIAKLPMSEYLWCSCVIRLMDLGKLKQNNANGVKFVYVAETINIKHLYTATAEKVNCKKTCFNCFKPSKLRCQNCSVKYCSTECQSCDWNFHKQICDHSKKPV